MPRVVLVTGVAGQLGSRFARTLAGAEDLEVVGVDVTAPSADLGRAAFVRADVRSLAIAKVLAAHHVDTVVHLALGGETAGARSSTTELDVLGTMQLLAACQTSDSFAKLVVQSSAAVYGASPRDPVRFTEDMSPRVPPRTGLGKDAVEIETAVRGLARRRPEVSVTTLRLAALMGADVDSQVSRYLSLPVVPRVGGFDARLQFLHPTDAVSALLRVTREAVPGTFNVAADDIVTLTQALRMLGRPTVGVPRALAPWLAVGLRQAGLTGVSQDQIDALTFGRGMDTGRFTNATGFRPSFSSRRALAEFASASSTGPWSATRIEPLISSLETRLTGLVAPRG